MNTDVQKTISNRLVINRWGTWLESALYSENFIDIKGMVNQFDSSDILSIHDTKEAFENPLIQQNLTQICTHF